MTALDLLTLVAALTACWMLALPHKGSNDENSNSNGVSELSEGHHDLLGGGSCDCGCHSFDAKQDEAQSIVDALQYANYRFNRAVLGMDPALYAKHSTQGAAFERRYLAELQAVEQS